MIKTALLFGYVGFTLIVLIPVGIIIFILRLVGLERTIKFLMSKIAKAWAWLLIYMIGSKVTISGRENIPSKGGLCFVCNHSGYFDIAIAFAALERPIGFIAKKELSYIPFLNIWIWLLGGFFIDRKNARKALVTIRKGVESLKAGGSMVIFPEGSRSKGQGLLPFHPGSFKLATQAGVPVVPVAITGSYETYEKTGIVRAVPINIVISPPIETAQLPAEYRKQQLSEKVRGIISKSLESLVADNTGKRDFINE